MAQRGGGVWPGVQLHQGGGHQCHTGELSGGMGLLSFPYVKVYWSQQRF